MSRATSSLGNPMRQQLEELDALLQRMLTLPIHQIEEPEEPAASRFPAESLRNGGYEYHPQAQSIAPGVSASENWPSTPSTLTERTGARSDRPMSPATPMPSNGSNGSYTSYTEGFPRAETPIVPGPWSAGAALPDSHGTTANPAASLPFPNRIASASQAPVPAPSPSSAVVRIEPIETAPERAAAPVTPPASYIPYEPVRWHLLPLVGFDIVVEAIASCCGSPGQWLCSWWGKNLLGFLGWLMILGSLAWGASEWFGWTW